MAMLIGELFRRNAAVVPARVAASLGDETLSHRQLDAAANRLARALLGLGVEPGERVAAWADTALEVLVLFAAASKLGAVFAPLNARWSVEEAVPVARLTAPRVLVADAGHAEAAAALAERAGVPHLARCQAAPGPGLDLSPASLGSDPQPLAPPRIPETAPHVLFFTSGSTGRPKGVVLSHRANFLRSFQGVFRDAPEISLCMFPLFHMAGFTLALAAWQTRGEIALVRAASAEELLAALEKRRANRFYGIPAVWARLLEADLGRWDTSSLREADTGTSATPIELVRALKERFPASATRIYYGSTEAGAATVLPDADVLRKPGSVGAAAPGVDLRVAGDGEILVRSEYLFDGYWQDPEASAAALRDGWLHTGDLGVLDGEGCLAIVGRKRELIRTGGESVAPREVEAILATHPAVAEVAVVGLPDARWGEVVCAAVVARAGARPTLEALQAHCEGRLAGFKKPRRLELVDGLPRTAATGQVQRTLLVEQLQSR
jgi:acyl-CoA synthetase (AMP-forming)/AMP-acid ligase II